VPDDTTLCDDITLGGDNFEKDGDNYKVWVQFEGLGDGCSGLIATGATFDPSTCSGFNGISAVGQCQQYLIPGTFHTSQCCGTACNNLKARSVVDSTKTLEKRHARDFALTARDDCSWTGPEPTVAPGAQRQILGDIQCGTTDGCMESGTTTTESSSSNTFEVSTEVGASIFDIISASLSLSDSFTQEECKCSHHSVS
jgi:hypothetical protein